MSVGESLWSSIQPSPDSCECLDVEYNGSPQWQEEREGGRRVGEFEGRERGWIIGVAD
jgi:hypothetical protein